MSSRILVADDQIANCELLVEILTAEGFEVITAGDGAEALNQFAATRPDLVLLDVIMPRRSGPEVFAAGRGRAVHRLRRLRTGDQRGYRHA